MAAPASKQERLHDLEAVRAADPSPPRRHRHRHREGPDRRPIGAGLELRKTSAVPPRKWPRGDRRGGRRFGGGRPGVGVGSPSSRHAGPTEELRGDEEHHDTAAAPKPKVTNLFMVGVLNGIRRSRSCGVLLAASKTASITWGGVVSEPALSHSAAVRLEVAVAVHANRPCLSSASYARAASKAARSTRVA